MQSKIITSIDSDFISDWRLLWDKSSDANFINGPQWFLSLLRISDKPYKIIACYSKNELSGVTYIFEDSYFGIKIYTVSMSDFSYGMPFLTGDNEKIYRQLLNKMVVVGTIVLPNIPEEYLRFLEGKKFTRKAVQTSKNYLLSVIKDENQQIIIKGRKSLLKEARKVIENYEIKAFTGKDKSALKVALRIDKKSQKQSRGYNAFSDERTKVFYEALAESFGDVFRINILYYLGKPVVYELGFLVNKIYTGSQVAFDKKYSKLTPGKVSEVKVIELMADAGAEMIDYGSGDSYIKRLITNEYRFLYTIVISRIKLNAFIISKAINIKASLFEKIQDKNYYYFYKKIRNHLK